MPWVVFLRFNKKETWKTATHASAQLDKTNLNHTTRPHQKNLLFSKDVQKWGFFSLLLSLSLGKTNASFFSVKNIYLYSLLSLPLCHFRAWKRSLPLIFSQPEPYPTRAASLLVSSSCAFLLLTVFYSCGTVYNCQTGGGEGCFKGRIKNKKNPNRHALKSLVYRFHVDADGWRELFKAVERFFDQHYNRTSC